MLDPESYIKAREIIPRSRNGAVQVDSSSLSVIFNLKTFSWLLIIIISQITLKTDGYKKNDKIITDYTVCKSK